MTPRKAQPERGQPMFCACGKEKWGRWQLCQDCRAALPRTGSRRAPSAATPPPPTAMVPVKADAPWERIRRATYTERTGIDDALWGEVKPRPVDEPPHYGTRTERLRLERKTPHAHRTFDHEAIAEMITESPGLSTREIAHHFGCSRDVVKKIRTTISQAERKTEGRAA